MTQEKLKQGREKRIELKENIVQQTLQRIKYVLGEHATEENIYHVAEPYLSLVDRYAVLVDESRVEIDGLN